MPIAHAAEPKLEGKTAIVVGASAGIGLASARRFAEHGANVVMVGRNQERLAVAADDIGEQALPVVADVRFEDQLKAAFDVALERWGQINVVFNNAGPGDAGAASIRDMTVDQFDDFIAVNLRSVFIGMKLAIPSMEEVSGGSLIATSSIRGIQRRESRLPCARPNGRRRTFAPQRSRQCDRARSRDHAILHGERRHAE